MIIQKMNNVLVKHGKVTFAIFTAVVIVSFVWFFTPGVDGSLLLGGNIGPNSKYGDVLGHAVTYADVGNAREFTSMVRGATYGVSPARVSSLDEDASFQAALLLKAADVMNIQASDREVAEVIHTLPSFQQDGKFSPELYAKYKEYYLAPSGLGYADLEEAVRSMIRMQKVPMATVGSVVVPAGEADAAIAGLLQKITYHLITFDPESFKDEVTVEDAEVKDFYTANPSYFMSEPESDGLLAFAAYTVKKNEVTEEQMKDYFEANEHSFHKEDGTHQTFEEAKDAIRKELETSIDTTEAEAKARAFNKSFREAIRADKEAYQADPEKLFREEAEKAGMKITELKNLTAQTASDEELHIDYQLVESVSILKNTGSYTNLMTGPDGISMFLMTARRPSVVQPFEDVKDVARDRVVARKENALADEASAQFSLKFAELKDAPAEIEDLVKSLHGTFHAELQRTRLDIEAAPYMPAVNAILTTDVGKLSAPDKQYGFPVFVFVTAHTDATAEEIAEQKESLEIELKYRKQDIVSRGLQDWVIESAHAFRRGQAQD